MITDSDVLQHGATKWLPAEFTVEVEPLEIGQGMGACQTTVYRRESVYVSDVTTDLLCERSQNSFVRHELRVCWSTPVMGRDGRLIRTSATSRPVSVISTEVNAQAFFVFEWLHGIETYSHTGIVCAIVRRAAELIGASFGVESGVGVGRTFRIPFSDFEQVS